MLFKARGGRHPPAGTVAENRISMDAVAEELDRILNSPTFAKSSRLARFLRFIVQETLQGRADQLKESLVGVEVFDREATYDPRMDAVVRTEAIKLRARLKDYYETHGCPDPIRIELPKGTYVPVFAEQAKAVTKEARSRSGMVALLVAPIAVVGLAAYWTVGRKAAVGVVGPPPAIAVLPFVNLSSDKENEYLSDGLTEELTEALAKVDGLRVVARTSVFQFKGKSPDVRDAGKQLNVGTVLEGGVRKDRDKLRVTARLIEVASGYRLWSETYDRELRDVFAIQEGIAQSVVRALKIHFRQPLEISIPNRYTRDAETYTLYMKARYFHDSAYYQDQHKAIQYYEQVIARDPQYARAYAGLSGTYFLMNRRQQGAPRELCGKARAAASKALELDSTLAIPHATLGQIKIYFDYDWVGGEREFQEAFRLEPHNGDLFYSYSRVLLYHGWFKEAQDAMERYFELTPGTPHGAMYWGGYYYWSNQWDRAIKILPQALEISPHNPLILTLFGNSYLKQGRYREALEQLEEALRVNPNTSGGTIMPLGYAHAVVGRRDEAIKLLNRLKEMSKHRYVTAFNLAPIYAGLGQRANALDSLEQAYEERAPNMLTLGVEIYFDSLRHEPRFQALLKKVGLKKFLNDASRNRRIEQ